MLEDYGSPISSEGNCLVGKDNFADINGGRLRFRFLNHKVHQNPAKLRPLIVVTGPGQNGIDQDLTFGIQLMNKLGDVDIEILLWDRRNIGGSSINYTLTKDNLVEEEAYDLYQLLNHISRLDDFFLLGMSSGARLSLVFALSYPYHAKGIILAPPTGGKKSNTIKLLTESYYKRYIRQARLHGMEGVINTGIYKRKSKEDKEKLLSMNKRDFIEVLEQTCKFFDRYANEPLIGATEQQLTNLTIPTLIVHSGDQTDKTHRLEDAKLAAKLIPGCQRVHILPSLQHFGPMLWEFICEYKLTTSSPELRTKL